MYKSLLSVAALWGMLINVSFGAAVEIIPESYTYDTSPNASYPDSPPGQLTDGIYGSYPITDAGPWVGWLQEDEARVNIDFEFSKPGPTIAQIDVGTVKDTPGFIDVPSIEIFSSNNGSSWGSPLASHLEQLFPGRVDGYYTITFDGLNITDRYVRVSLINVAEGATRWNFTDEIDFATPIPASVWLFGSALLGLLGLRKKSQAVVSQ